MAANKGPLHQFEISSIYDIKFKGLDLSFTNSSLSMVLAIIIASIIFHIGSRKNGELPNKLQVLVEMSYEFIANMVRDNVGKGGKIFFPFIFSLFLFILFGNVLGMVPYNFTYTSHIIVTFALAGFIFIAVTIIGLVKHGINFLKFFVPSGVPISLLPILIPIEIISYFVRPISLSLRLFANMMAGHTMLKVFASFIVLLGILGGWAPLLLVIILTGFEIMIAVLQAYVFTILCCLYLNDALNLHH
ncbi:MAG: F0F1 ATP synthase subunit A [Alphaproteobacteria bacterium TMED93]|mgnify:FL=1|nr:MAG: F0F1 ATP synthase subunit A [Alphaproteobacteria bacterium TMED93]